MFSVIQEHDDFLIINKHPGCSFHQRDDKDGLFMQVQEAYSNIPLYPVHRLDDMTSGLLLIAKSKHAAKILNELFFERRIEKYYIALSTRSPKKKQGLIQGEMQRSRNGNWKLTRGNRNPAITRFLSQSIGRGQRLYLLKPETGKTHQLRVALQSISAPILGDPRYAPKGDVADRGYLHAYALRFQYNQQTIEIQSRPDIGEYFVSSACQRQLDNWTPPWSQAWPRSQSDKLSLE